MKWGRPSVSTLPTEVVLRLHHVCVNVVIFKWYPASSLFSCSLLKLTKACVNFIVAPQTPQQLGSNQDQRLAIHQQSLDRARDIMRSNSMSSNGNLSFPKRPRLDRDSWKSRIEDQGSIKNEFLNEPKQTELAKHKHGVNTVHTCSQTAMVYFLKKCIL